MAIRPLLTSATIALAIAGLTAAPTAATAASAATARPAAATQHPAPVTAVRAYQGATKVKITWANPHSTYDHVILRYRSGAVAPTSAAQGASATVAKGATSAILPLLKANTRYGVTLWVINKSGLASVAKDVVFTTPDAATTSPPAPTTGTVEGTITDTAGHPLAGAQVRVYSQVFGTSPTDVTDAAGHYGITFDAFPALLLVGGQTATGGSADATGYVSQSPAVTIVAGHTTTRDIELAPGGIITGHAVDAAGDPVAGALVRASQIVDWAAGSLPSAGPAVGATSTSDGSFTLRGVSTTASTLCAAIDASASYGCLDTPIAADAGASRSAGDVTVGAASTSSSASARTRTAKSASSAVAQPHASTTVPALIGVVRGPTGTPLAGVTVATKLTNGTALAVTDANGQYRTNDSLGTGVSTLCVSVQTPITGAPLGALGCISSVRTTAGSTRLGIDFTLQSAAALSGTVRDSDGNVVAGAVITLGAVNNAVGHAVSDSTGHYVIAGQQTTASTGVCVYLTFYADHQSCTHVALTEGRTTTLDLATPGFGSADVKVTDGSGNPLTGARALLLSGGCDPFELGDGIEPDYSNCHTYNAAGGSDLEWYAQGISAGDGSVHLGPVTAGSHYLCVLGYDAITNATAYPAGGYADKCSQVTVTNRGTLTENVSLAQGATVSGTVKHADGTPAANIHVVISRSSQEDPRYVPIADPGAPNNADALTDADGHYTVRSINPGASTITFDGKFFGATPSNEDGTPVTLTAGTNPAVDFTLPES